MFDPTFKKHRVASRFKVILIPQISVVLNAQFTLTIGEKISARQAAGPLRKYALNKPAF